MSTPRIVRGRAFAKINLTLHVGERRADGYHGLQTVFQALTLHDTIVCRARRGPFAVECDDAAVPADESNLVWRAARALWRRLGRPGEPVNCAVSIGKQIPLQAGLGGGSADAAAALAALNRLWGGGLSPSDLGQAGAGIGADVPYFFVGGAAIGLGRGDDVYPLPDLKPRWVVLACPPFGVATADAYAWFDADRSAGATGGQPVPPALGAWGRALAVRNDLQGPVSRRHEEIGRLARVLLGAGAEAAAMTGSGSTVFGVFAARTRARAAAHEAAAAGAQAIVTQTATRAWCRRALGVPRG